MNNAIQQQLTLPNNNPGMQNRPPLGAGILQNMNPFMNNMQPMIDPLPFIHATNNFHPLQHNQLVPPHLALLGQQNGVGYMNCNPMFPVQGQNMVNGGLNYLCQAQGHILAQNIASLLQQNNMNMQNGQLPLQNMNQQLPIKVSNPAQVIPYGMPPGSHPMCNFPNQVPQAMVPQNPFSSANMQLNNVPGNQMPQAMVSQNPFPSANLPLNHMPGNQVRAQVIQNENNVFSPVKTNAFTSSPFSSQQLEGNARAPSNPNGLKQPHAKHSQPGFTNFQVNPMNNVKANAPNHNWKGSPNKKFKNNPNQGRFQGGFQKSKFHDNNKGKKKFGAPKEHRQKGFNNENAGNSGLNYKEQNKEPKRSSSVIYTDQEIQQWREARKKNYPTKDHIQKKQTEKQSNLKVTDREVFRRELKEILAKQAELGVEVAEIPSYYLKDSTTKSLEGEEKRNSNNNKRKLKNKFDRRTDRKNRHSKKQKFGNKDLAQVPSSSDKRSPTLLQKLLSADIKKDKSHLLQAFRFMLMNSFFQDCPDKPLRYPSVMVKENGPEVIENGDCDDDEEEENESIKKGNPQEEDSEEEGEIVD